MGDNKVNAQTANSLKIYNVAKASLGQVLSGDNATFGCAASVNEVVKRALGAPVGGGYSTSIMRECLVNSPNWTPVSGADALPGDIIISATGLGNGTVPNGHTGVLGIYGICSNNSEDGTWEEKWKLDSWRQYYGALGGYPVEFFRAV